MYGSVVETTRGDIVIDTFDEQSVFYCKACGRPFAGIPNEEFRWGRTEGTVEAETDRLIEAHLTNCGAMKSPTTAIDRR